MRNAFLVLTFISLTATMCPPPPYRTKNLYAENKSDSNRIILNNGLQLVFKYSHLDWNSQHIGVSVFCELNNPTSSVQVLERKNFSAFSVQGIKFNESPMQTADESGLWFKLYTQPDSYPIASEEKRDYVFIFYSNSRFSKREAIDFLKRDTVVFLFDEIKSADTLFKIVGNDSRINRL